jgi:hypothetical protein
MLHGNVKKTLLLLVGIVTITSLFCCQKRQSSLSSGKESQIINTDLRLSGVWYKSLNQMMDDPVKQKFRWGEVAVNYSTALCIDLEGGKGFLQYKDGGFLLDTCIKIGTNIFQINAHDSGSSSIVKLYIDYFNDDQIKVYFESGVNTGYTKDLAGKYSRKEGPRY